ncbi:MAG: tetratricopeptide repeat protein [Candidatus Omnitrophica bacterium]|nr:tetratricopeptide repeat protein [Candidatus Omnitrophota bacterium]
MGNLIPKLHFKLIISIFLLLSFAPFSFSEIKKDNKQAQDYRDRGYQSQKAGNLDMASSFYKRATEFDPTYALAYNDLGIVLEAKGEISAAKEAYSKAIEANPNYLSPYYNLAALYEKEGNLDKALYYWQMRVQMGDWSDAWTWKAKEHKDALEASGKISENAKPELTKAALNMMPDAKRDAQYHMYRGRQNLILGNYVAALKELNAAAALDPQNQEIDTLLEDAQRKILLYK